MRLDFAFFRSFYLTLGLAGACLVYGFSHQLPEGAPLFVPLAAAALGMAWLLEGRWSLSFWAANGVAVLIAGGVGVWVAAGLLEVGPPRAELLVAQSRALLPQLAALWLVLLLAKLFRPKRIADLWFLHAMAFVMVALACSVDSDFLLGCLVLAYLVSLVRNLGLLFVRRELAGAVGGRIVPANGDGEALRDFSSRRAGRRVAGLGVAALVLFLLTPRSLIFGYDTGPGGAGAYQSGVGDGVVDLNRTGSIQLNTEVAFEVSAQDPGGQPRLDLDPNQRWRVTALNSYELGRWYNNSTVTTRAREEARTESLLPRPGPGLFRLTFRFPNGAPRRLVLAEPIYLSPASDRLPVVVADLPAPVAAQLDAEVFVPRRRRTANSYTQTMGPPLEPNVSFWTGPHDMRDKLLRRPPPVNGLREFTVDLLRRLVSQGALDAADLQRAADGALLPENHARVARALEAHLAGSGDYSYTLEFTRQDRRIDPILDFLRNVKQGHCERFASGLALMLRSQGVPARIVVGFRGCESQDDGNYLVRQSHAHSWVEVQLPRPFDRGATTYHWLALDPTPAEDAGPSEKHGWLEEWKHFQLRAGILWRGLITEYQLDPQGMTVFDLWNRLKLREWLAGLVQGPVVWIGVSLGLLAAVGLTRRLRRREPAPGGAVEGGTEFYGSLLRLLAARCGLRPQTAHTAREFAEAAGVLLRSLPGTAPVAEVPAKITRLYYRSRYSGRSLDAVERETAQAWLGQLEQGLRPDR